MADPWMQPNNKSKYWQNMLRKYEQRNARLQSEECELRHKLEALECSLPIMLCMNVMNQGQPISAPINDSEVPIRDIKSPQVPISNTPYCSCTNCSKAAAGECDCGTSPSKPSHPNENQRPTSSGSASAPTIQPDFDKKCHCKTNQTSSSHSQVSNVPQRIEQRDDVPERVPQQTVSLPAKFSNEFCPCEDCVLLPMGQCDCGIDSSNAFCPCENCELLAQGVCDCGPQNDKVNFQNVPKSGGAATTSKPAVNKKKPFTPCDCTLKKTNQSKSPPIAPKPKWGFPSDEQEISITNPLQQGAEGLHSTPYNQRPMASVQANQFNEPTPSTTVSSVAYPKSGKYTAPYPHSTQDSKHLKPLNQPVSHQYPNRELPHDFSNDNCDCRKCTLMASAECECPPQSKSTIPPSSVQPQYQNDDLSLLDSEDFLIIERVKHLAEKEKSLKQNINELHHKENAINETIETVHFLKSNPIMNNNGNVPFEDNQGNIMENLQRLNDSLLQENSRISDELADGKLDMKQMKERVEGPMQRELEREKRKSKNMEDDLTRAKEEKNRSEDTLKKEIDFLKMQVEATAAQNTDLKALNGRLKDELNLMDTKCNELHQDLINQKISEANTLSRMKAGAAASAPLATYNQTTTLAGAFDQSAIKPALLPTSLQEGIPFSQPTLQQPHALVLLSPPPQNSTHINTSTTLPHPMPSGEKTEQFNEGSPNAFKIVDQNAPLDTPGPQDQIETAAPDLVSKDIPSPQDHIVNMVLIQQETPDLGKVSQMYASGEKSDLIKPTLQETSVVDDINSSQIGSTTKEVKPVKITTKPTKARDKVRQGSSLNALARDLSDLLKENEDNINIPKDMKETAHEIKVLVDLVDKKLPKPRSFSNTTNTKPTTELFKGNLTNTSSEELPQEKQEDQGKKKCPCLETALSLITKKLDDKWTSKVPSNVDDNTKDIVKIGLQPKQLEDEATEDTEFEDAMDEIPKFKKEMANEDNNIEDNEEETFISNLDPTQNDNINTTEKDLDNTSPLGKELTENVVYEEQIDEPVPNVEKDVESAENITNTNVYVSEPISASSKLKKTEPKHSPGKVLKKLGPSNDIDIETELEADDDVDVNTEIMIVKRNMNGIHMTTTLTKSGTLEVVTTGPVGIIETTMTLTESGNIEVVTQITDFDEDKDDVEDEENTTTDTETDLSSRKDDYDDDRDDYETKPGGGRDPTDNSKIRKGNSKESNKKRNNNSKPYTESSTGNSNPSSKFHQAAVINPQFSEKTILKKSSIHKRKLNKMRKEKLNIFDNTIEKTESTAIRLPSSVLSRSNIIVIGPNAFVLDQLTKILDSNKINISRYNSISHKISNECALFEEFLSGKINTTLLPRNLNKEERKNMLSSIRNSVSLDVTKGNESNDFNDGSDFKKIFCADSNHSLANSHGKLNYVESKSSTAIAICPIEGYTDIKRKRELEEIINSDKIERNTDFSMLNTQIKSLYNIALHFSNIMKEKSASSSREIKIHNVSSITKAKIVKSDTNSARRVHKCINKFTQLSRTVTKQQSISDRHLKSKLDRQCIKARGDKANILSKKDLKDCKYESNLSDLYSENDSKVLYLNSIKPPKEIHVAVVTEPWSKVKLTEKDIQRLNIRTLFQSSSSIENLIKQYSSSEKNKIQPCCNDLTGTYAAALQNRNTLDKADTDITSEKIKNSLEIIDTKQIKETVPTNPKKKKLSGAFKNANAVLDEEPKSTVEANQIDTVSKVEKTVELPHGDGFRKNLVLTENSVKSKKHDDEQNIMFQSDENKLGASSFDKVRRMEEDIIAVNDLRSMEAMKPEKDSFITKDNKNSNLELKSLENKLKKTSDLVTKDIKRKNTDLDDKVSIKKSNDITEAKSQDEIKSNTSTEVLNKNNMVEKSSSVEHHNKVEKVDKVNKRNMPKQFSNVDKIEMNTASHTGNEFKSDNSKPTPKVAQQNRVEKKIIENENNKLPISSGTPAKIIKEKPSNAATKFPVDKAKNIVSPEIIDKTKPEKVFVGTSNKVFTATKDIKAHSSDVIIKTNSNIPSDPKLNEAKLNVETDIVSAVPNENTQHENSNLLLDVKDHPSKSAKPIIEIVVEADKSKTSSIKVENKSIKSEQQIELNSVSEQVPDMPDIIREAPHESIILLPADSEKILDNDVGNKAISEYIENKKESEDQIVELLKTYSEKVDKKSLLHAGTENEEKVITKNTLSEAPDLTLKKEDIDERSKHKMSKLIDAIQKQEDKEDDEIDEQTIKEEIVSNTSDRIREQEGMKEMNDQKIEEGSIRKVDTSAERKGEKDALVCTCDVCNCPSETDYQKSEYHCICIKCNCEPVEADTNDSDKCDCKPEHCKCTDANDRQELKVDNKNANECICKVGYCNCKIIEDIHCSCLSGHCECTSDSIRIENYGDMSKDEECTCKVCVCSTENSNPSELKISSSRDTDASAKCICAKCICSDDRNEQNVQGDPKTHTNGLNCSCNQCNCIAGKVQERKFEIIDCTCKECKCLSKKTHSFATDTKSDTFEKYKNSASIDGDQTLLIEINNRQIAECICSLNACICSSPQQMSSGKLNIKKENDKKCTCEPCLLTQNEKSNRFAKGTSAGNKQTSFDQSFAGEIITAIVEPCNCAPFDCKCMPIEIAEQPKVSEGCTCKPFLCSCDVPNNNAECTCDPFHCLCEEQSTITAECEPNNCTCRRPNKSQPDNKSISTKSSEYVDCICMDCLCESDVDNLEVIKEKIAKVLVNDNCSCSKCDCPIEQISNIPEEIEDCVCVPLSCSCDSHDKSKECTCDSCNCLCESDNPVISKEHSNTSSKTSNLQKDQDREPNSISVKSSEYVDCNCTVCSCMPDLDNICTCEICICPIKEESSDAFNGPQRIEETINENDCICTNCECPVQPNEDYVHEIGKECTCDPSHCLCESDNPVISKEHSNTSSKISNLQKDQDREPNSISVKSSEYVDCNCTVCSCMPDLDNIAATCTCETCICPIKEESSDVLNGPQRIDETINENDCICTNCECPIEPSENDGQDIVKECSCDPSHCLCESDNPVISKEHSNTSSKISNLQKDQDREPNSISVKSSEYVDCNCTVCSCMPDLDNICTCEICICPIKEESSDAFNGPQRTEETINENDCICTNCECPVEPSEDDGQDIAKECTCDPSHCLCEEQSINTIECTCDPYNCFCEDHDRTNYKSSKDKRNQDITKSTPIRKDKLSDDVNSISRTRNDIQADTERNSLESNKTEQNSTKQNIQLDFEELSNSAKSGKLVELVTNSSLKLLLSKYVHNAIIINLKEDMIQANQDVLEVIEEANRKVTMVLQRIDKQVQDKLRNANCCKGKRSRIPIYKESSQHSDVGVEEYIGDVMFDNNPKNTHDNDMLSEYTSAVSTFCAENISTHIYKSRNPGGSRSYECNNITLRPNISSNGTFAVDNRECSSGRSKLYLENYSISSDSRDFNSAITNSEFGIPFVNSIGEQASGLKIDGLDPDVSNRRECDNKNFNIMSNESMISKIEMNKQISGITAGVKNIFVRTDDEKFEEHDYSNINLFASFSNEYVPKKLSNNKKYPADDIDDSSRIKVSESHIAAKTFFENEKLLINSNCNQLYDEEFNKYCTGDIDHAIAKENNNHKLEVDKNIDLKQVFEIGKQLTLNSDKMLENSEQYVKNDAQILCKERSDTISEKRNFHVDLQQEKMLLMDNLVNNQYKLNKQKSAVILETSKGEDHHNKSRNDLQICIIESDGNKIRDISYNAQNTSKNEIVKSSNYISFNDGQANISNFDSRFINSDECSEEIIAYFPKLTNCSFNGSVSRIIARKIQKTNSLFKYPIKLSDVKCVYTKRNDIIAASKINNKESIIATSNHLVSRETVVSFKSEAITSFINYLSDQRSDTILTSSDELLSPLNITTNPSNNIIHILGEVIKVKQNQYSSYTREQSSTRQNDSKVVLKCNPQTIISNFHHVPVLSTIDECSVNAERSPICNFSKLDQIDEHGDGDDETDDEWEDALEIIPKTYQTADIVGDTVYRNSIKLVDAKAQTSNVGLNINYCGDIEADHGYSCECIDCLTAPCTKAFATIRSIAEPILECPLCNRIECIGGCKTPVIHQSAQDEDILGVTQSDKVCNQCLLGDCTLNIGDGLVENKDFRSLPCVMNTVVRSNGSTKFLESACRVSSNEGDALSFDHYQSIPVRDLYISDVTDINKSDDDLNELQNIMKQISSACLKAGSRIPIPLVYYQNPSNPTSVTSLQIALKNLQAKCHNKDSLMKAMICELQTRVSKEFSLPEEFSEIIGQNYNKHMRNIEVKECSGSNISENTNHNSYENIVSRKQYNSHSSSIRSRSNRSSCLSCTQSTSEGLRSNRPSEEVINVKSLQMIEVKRIGDDSLLVKWKAPVNERILGYEVCVDDEVKTRVYRRTRTMAVISAVPLDRKPIVNISVYACTDKGRCLPAALASFHT